jgi:two-component system response regulator VicR
MTENYRILLAGTTPELTQELSDTLKQKNYKVSCIHSISDFTKPIRSAYPDLVILDPSSDGSASHSQLIKFQEIIQIPVIVVSSASDVSDKVRWLEDGADDYLVKPFDQRELAARVHAVIRRTMIRVAKQKQDLPKLLEYPDLTIDLFSGTAELDGNACSLPQRELQILYLLASRIGSRISYHEIYETIYGCDVEDSKNTIRVNISRLKKHLAMDDMSTYEITATADGEYVLRRVIF